MVPRDIAQELARGASRQPGLRRQARPVDARATRPTSKVSTSPLSRSARPRTPRWSCAISRAATRSTACISTTRAIRPTGSITAAPRFASSARRSDLFSERATTQRARTPRRATDLFAYPDALPDEWRQFQGRAHDRAHGPSPGRGEERASGGDRQRRGCSRSARRLVSQAAGLGRLAQRRGSSTLCARWCTRRKRPASPSRSPAPGRSPGSSRSGPGSAPTVCRLPQTIENIQTARKLGAGRRHPVLLRQPVDPQQSAPGYLATVSRAVFADRGATESGSASTAHRVRAYRARARRPATDLPLIRRE